MHVCLVYLMNAEGANFYGYSSYAISTYNLSANYYQATNLDYERPVCYLFHLCPLAYHYYSARDPAFVYLPVKNRRLSWPVCNV